MQRNELAALLSEHTHRLLWRRPTGTPPGEDTVELLKVESGVLLRGPGIQLELILTTPEWRVFVRAIKAGEFDDTI
ncbi:hypothetical protein I6A60_01700 [Frankia sp. AgB1.9]|uniref:DUF397 domain-containing protein n=1 Tax=unclassified Frankia TaxID=2632575 RepID=UPI0019314815|nr:MULTISPECIES: DUF397 domain-containing protein [unclassified Frankia]MBL7491321.1 hypothetical protein [Frankia sp. AgW1.1]MBL7546599.1 hypothetical protein [Frankia sp. AgB1.9]MBL7624667.1 hypothetical protein [Frankia sp. AgB1.8]